MSWRRTAFISLGLAVTVNRAAGEGAWRSEPPLRIAVEWTAATVASGTIYVVGGTSNGPTMSSVQAYDSGSRIWSLRAPLPGARQLSAVATGPDGCVYVFGGISTGVVSWVDRYDPVLNQWTSRSPLPSARYGACAVLGSNGLIYVIGGYTTNHISEVYAYNTLLDTWTLRTPMPTQRSTFAAAMAPDGRIFAVGGHGNGNIYLSDNECYDVASDTWTSMAPMPNPRRGLGFTCCPDGRLIAVGGLVPVFGTGAVEAYSPASNTWRTLTSLPNPRGAFATALGSDGRVYAMGGYSGGLPDSALVDSFDPVAIVPSDYIVTSGYEVFGGLESLHSSDDSCLGVFPHEETLMAQVVAWGHVPNLNPSAIRITVESVVGRTGLSQQIDLFNYDLHHFVQVDGRVAPIAQTIFEFELTGQAPSVISETGEAKVRITWLPINDEDPAQDGWLHCIDAISWTYDN